MDVHLLYSFKNPFRTRLKNNAFMPNLAEVLNIFDFSPYMPMGYKGKVRKDIPIDGN